MACYPFFSANSKQQFSNSPDFPKGIVSGYVLTGWNAYGQSFLNSEIIMVCNPIIEMKFSTPSITIGKTDCYFYDFDKNYWYQSGQILKFVKNNYKTKETVLKEIDENGYIVRDNVNDLIIQALVQENVIKLFDFHVFTLSKDVYISTAIKNANLIPYKLYVDYENRII